MQELRTSMCTEQFLAKHTSSCVVRGQGRGNQKGSFTCSLGQIKFTHIEGMVTTFWCGDEMKIIAGRLTTGVFKEAVSFFHALNFDPSEL